MERQLERERSTFEREKQFLQVSAFAVFCRFYVCLVFCLCFLCDILLVLLCLYIRF